MKQEQNKIELEQNELKKIHDLIGQTIKNKKEAIEKTEKEKVKGKKPNLLLSFEPIKKELGTHHTLEAIFAPLKTAALTKITHIIFPLIGKDSYERKTFLWNLQAYFPDKSLSFVGLNAAIKQKNKPKLNMCLSGTSDKDKQRIKDAVSTCGFPSIELHLPTSLKNDTTFINEITKLIKKTTKQINIIIAYEEEKDILALLERPLPPPPTVAPLAIQSTSQESGDEQARNDIFVLNAMKDAVEKVKETGVLDLDVVYNILHESGKLNGTTVEDLYITLTKEKILEAIKPRRIFMPRYHLNNEDKAAETEARIISLFVGDVKEAQKEALEKVVQRAFIFFCISHKTRDEIKETLENCKKYLDAEDLINYKRLNLSSILRAKHLDTEEKRIECLHFFEKIKVFIPDLYSICLPCVLEEQEYYKSFQSNILEIFPEAMVCTEAAQEKTLSHSIEGNSNKTKKISSCDDDPIIKIDDSRMKIDNLTRSSVFFFFCTSQAINEFDKKTLNLSRIRNDDKGDKEIQGILKEYDGAYENLKLHDSYKSKAVFLSEIRKEHFDIKDISFVQSENVLKLSNQEEETFDQNLKQLISAIEEAIKTQDTLNLSTLLKKEHVCLLKSRQYFLTVLKNIKSQLPDLKAISLPSHLLPKYSPIELQLQPQDYRKSFLWEIQKIFPNTMILISPSKPGIRQHDGNKLDMCLADTTLEDKKYIIDTIEKGRFSEIILPFAYKKDELFISEIKQKMVDNRDIVYVSDSQISGRLKQRTNERSSFFTPKNLPPDNKPLQKDTTKTPDKINKPFFPG